MGRSLRDYKGGGVLLVCCEIIANRSKSHIKPEKHRTYPIRFGRREGVILFIRIVIVIR
ncbi:MAG: hypothetical protein ACJARL_000293 [Halopseudomonas sp.]|jgi:hypothetical protein